jgi:hypothetical protein
MGHGISPSRGTAAAAVNHFKNVACSDFHIGDVVPHSEDHGQTTEHYRPVLNAALAKKRTCKRKGQRMRNPNTGKPMSNKKKNQAEKRRRAQERAKAERAKAERAKAEKAAEQQRQQEMEDEVVREMERERAQDSSSNEGSQGMSAAEMAAYGDCRIYEETTKTSGAKRNIRTGRNSSAKCKESKSLHPCSDDLARKTTLLIKSSS